MSDANPPEFTPDPVPEGTEPTSVLPREELPAEQLGAPVADTGSGSGTRRTAIIAAVAVVVAAILGGGAWAAYSILSGGGPQPADALPASTVAMVSIDLDPSASQKIAAIKAIRKFPALKKSLGLQADDDLRKYIFDKATGNGDCSTDFDDDVKPWIGKRAAFAAVDLGDKDPAPAIAIQVSDPAKARNGFAAIVMCADPGDNLAFAVGDDYLIASDSTAHAKQILADGVKKPLADDVAYQKWTDEAGDAGVMNFYVAKKAADYLGDLLGAFDVDGSGGSGTDSSSGSVGSSAPMVRSSDEPDPFAPLRDRLDKFEGLAGTIRFADGGMELSVVAGGLDELSSASKVGNKISSLPKDSAIAVGFGVADDYAGAFMDGFKAGAGSSADDLEAQVEEETGLKLPEDLQTLLGSAITLSVGGHTPASLDDIQGPSDLPVGLVIHGDTDKIKDLIATIEKHTGFKLSDIPIEIEGTDSKLVLSPSSDYADELLKDGNLGSSDNFSDAVPNADRASGVFYVDFDSDWVDTILDFAKEDGASAEDVQTAEQNIKPLKSLGLSTWLGGGVSHVLVKVATN